MKIKFRHTRIFTLLLTLLLLAGAANQAWAYKVTYHILTLPIENSIYHMNAEFAGKRLEAVRVVDNNATKVDLPDAYKSPLATNFQYYASTDVTQSSEAKALYAYADKNKSFYYEINGGATDIKDNSVTQNMDVYVTYEYNASNPIADLSGATEYNLTMSNGFLALNRGRNNRIAVFQKSLDLVKAEDLVSEDFVQYPYTSGNKIDGTNIGTYWQSNDNKNTKANVAGQFHFIFKFEGSDPYNIIIGTAYDRDYAYIEKHGSETTFRYKWYKGSHLYRPSSDGTGFFMASDDHKEYTTTGSTYNPDPMPDITYDASKTGYFRSKASTDLTYSTFALLNNSNSPSNGYVFMVSRFVNGEGDLSTPGDYKNASYNYLIRDDNYNNLTYKSLTLANVSKSYSTDQKIYQVENYVYKLKKHTTDEVLSVKTRVSEYYLGADPTSLVPEELKRKYATFKGAYKEEACTNQFATFADVDASATTETIDGKVYKVIWLDYEVNMPFETWTKAGGSDTDDDDAPDYEELKWYNIHAEKNANYILSWDGSKIVTRGVAYRYPRHTHFAFIGDPYDLKIVSRTASQDVSGNPSTLKYMELADPIDGNAGFDTDGNTWGIVYDDNTADNMGCFRLKDNSVDNYLHIKNASGESYPLNGTATLGEAVRITVDNLPNKSYVYYIMRSDGSIAAMSQAFHEPSAKLDYDHIPASIRSPFIKDVALTFYGGTTSETTAKTNAASQTSPIYYTSDTDDGGIQYIVVRYDAFASSPQVERINGTAATATFNVRLNGQYIYYDKAEEVDANKIKSSATIVSDVNREYNWTLGGSDPYAMTIKPQSVAKYIAISNWPANDEEGVGEAISWTDAAPSSKYIIKSSTTEGAYEVMGATGESYDSAEQTFNFGRPTDNTVKMYSDWSYLSGGDVLRFELVPTTAQNVTYHLIDIKNNTELLRVVTRQASTAAPSFPPDYRSPLVDTYTYWGSLTDAQNKSGANPATVGSLVDIYVTYTANNLVDMTGKTTYLMKYAMGDQFRQEDGSDGLLDPISEFSGEAAARRYRYQAVYPYCNGDCNFFVYGQEQYDIQQQGAASTRTRWAWYVESVSGDPYHVKISSRQQEIYPTGSENYYNAYFRTYKPSGYSEVVTTLAWPGISGEQGTEYMVLGSAGQFRLLTSDAINDGTTTERRAVNSFEQYWKTWNTIRLKVLGDKNAEAKQSDPNTVPATPAAPTAAEASKDNRTYLTEVMGWHSYENWAYGIRWNDYNKDGEKNKKGWESIEHWYQTINMGEGYFDFVKTSIDPVLILLDQHGWEVMRKPLPSSPDDPYKYEKYDAIRPYDSPMVKEYYFWTKTSKRTGFHQYHTLSQQITVDGEPFTSTSLTNLPPFDATNVLDNKGNLYDQYVTYTVKDEYLKACNVELSYTDDVVDPADAKKTYSKVTAIYEGVPFLIRQGDHFVSATDETTLKNDNVVPTTGGMSKYIIDNISNLTTSGSKKNELWYLMPNINIDGEMGYDNYAHSWASDYDRKDKVQKSGFNSWAFDPYNIQISSVPHSTSYFVTNATKAEIDEGSILGNGTTNALGAQASVDAALVGGMDNRTLRMTNATFMAVLDEHGNMQLMPRFDQEKRLKDFTALVQTDDAEEEKTHTILYRPEVYNYHIIDNDGNESLRYQGGGDLLPQTPGWFQSQLAKDYTYHTANPCTDENKITESLDGATLTDNNVYVRYSYDEDADYNNILKGKWLTMTLNEKDAQYTTVSETAGVYSGTKPDPVNGTQKMWQWKFISTSEPDPYAVSLYNRNTSAGTATAVKEKTKFALLNWYDASGVDATKYTLAVAGTESYTYDFVNGNYMSSSVAATTAAEYGVTSTSCSYDGTQAQIVLNDDVEHSYEYRVYTNDNPVTPVHDGKYGVFAVSASQDYSTVSENDFVPILPEEIKSPLLNIDQFKYYGAEADMGDEKKELKKLFGLYDDIVYVRYTDYDPLKTEYKVPNVKTVVDSKVARGEDSNDAALDIKGELIYNIIWYNDNMMSSNGSTISDGGSQTLDGNALYVWQFEGNDPYAIKIRHKNSNKYAVGGTDLAATATSTFMLLPSTDADWQYGMLRVTGGTNKLSGYGQTTTTDNPTKFIIFGLSTHKVIYHLVIANIGNSVSIPYRETKGGLETTKSIDGSTCRDLTTTTTVTGDYYQLGETKTLNGSGVTYCIDDGHITLGDPLKVPDVLKRPNCKYFFYVEGVYTNEDCSRAIPYGTEGTHIAELDGNYRGLQIKQMGTEPELLGKTVVINIVYEFDDGLPTNNGANFVTTTTGTQWFTTETNDATPYLARLTYDQTVQSAEGREPHYTNEFLWKPVGDPYGFKMYNRYAYKNAGLTNYVMTTTEDPDDGQSLTLNTNETYGQNAIYELFAGETAGYFIMRPMLNNDVAIYNNAGTVTLSATNASEWTFGLSENLFKPYRDRAGYVGGLNDTGKEDYDAAGDLQTIQSIVYDDANIVTFAPGYYRLHNLPNTDGITTPRYMSGYLHETEKTAGASSTAIPMHFYSRMGVNTTFEVLDEGYTRTSATQGQIPVLATEYDPSTIFHITGTTSAAQMSTQGLNVIENKMGEATGTFFNIVDIGGACVVIYDASSNYLSYNGTNKYDIGFDAMTPDVAERSKWCMEPANKTGLYIETHSGGEEETLTNLWYYSSYCVPFDMLIANKTEDEEHSSNAYTCIESESPWTTTMLHPKPIGKYTTAAGTYSDELCWKDYPANTKPNDYFVPAGTPVLFSTKNATKYIKATIPTTTPSASIPTIFSYKYLEQLLSGWDNSDRVYVFGPKMEGTLTLNESDGTVTATLASLGNTNVGFHINATPNKETGLTTTSWQRNNYYVLHNKIYYRASGSGSRELSMRGIEFVPVIFDNDEEGGEQPNEEEQNPSEGASLQGDGCIYDMMGRKVATRQQVEDGSWRLLRPGIYILNGKKFRH